MKIKILTSAIAVILGLSGCNTLKTVNTDMDGTEVTSSVSSEEGGEAASSVESGEDTQMSAEEEEAVYERAKALYDTKADTLPQLSEPKSGDTKVTLHTNKGDIVLRVFPEYAPKAVENFVTHAKEGYYDGLTFHRVINQFMIQGGDPKGDGTGGESIWGGGFGVEPALALKHFRGALCMAQSSMPDSIGSQFYIVQNSKLDAQAEQMLEQYAQSADEVAYESPKGDFKLTTGDMFPKAAIEQYKKEGGTPHLDFQYTVFGQVTEGMDVVDAIASVKVGENDKPLEDIIIEKAEVGQY